MSQVPYNALLHGRVAPPADGQAVASSHRFMAGPLDVLYCEGDLRYIRYRGREVVRRIYVAVRDRNWWTVPGVLSDVQIHETPDGVSIRYRSEHTLGDIDFAWVGQITASASGEITFTMDGCARSTFLSNRTGFCVLHPIRECAGRSCTIEHADGTSEQALFPQFISPHQPFKNVRALSHEILPGVLATVRFGGDIFETEDQRNWTDASYKTYCRPLERPFPFVIEKGSQLRQSVTLTVTGDAAVQEDDGEWDIRIEPGTVGPLPHLGLHMASHQHPLPALQVQRLRTLKLSYLRVDLRLWQKDYPAELARAHSEAEAIGVPLEIALHLTHAAEAELGNLVAAVQCQRPMVCRWIIFHENEKTTSPKWVELARRHLSGYDPAAKIGSGTNAYFAELNRNREVAGVSDFLCYSANPQMHAFDDLSLMENLQAQADTVLTARQFAPSLPLTVGPITLRRRHNPDATGLDPQLPPGELPPQVDVRQMSLLAAAWTVGSYKYLAEAGADNITYYETTGWRGVMETESGSPLPDVFFSWPGCVFPLYHVLADIGEFAGGEVLASRSRDPLRCEMVVLRHGGKYRAIVANLTASPQLIRLMGIPEGGRVTAVKALNADVAPKAMQQPEAFRAAADPARRVDAVKGVYGLHLAPFAVLRIDMER